MLLFLTVKTKNVYINFLKPRNSMAIIFLTTPNYWANFFPNINSTAVSNLHL